VGAEPRLRVFLVRIYDKPRIRCEIIRSPFPNIADHLTATESAVPAWMRAHLSQTRGVPVQVSSFHTGRIVAPRKMAAVILEKLAIRGQLRGRSDFPFRLCRQSPPGPIAVSLSFLPVNVNHGEMFVWLYVAIKKTLLPATVRIAPPISGMV